MLGLGSLTKLIRGGMGIDELSEMLSGMIGGEVEITPIQETAPEVVQSKLGEWIPGSKSVVVSGTTRTGERLKAIIILQPPAENPSLPS
jgi:hypothetical protein